MERNEIDEQIEEARQSHLEYQKCLNGRLNNVIAYALPAGENEVHIFEIGKGFETKSRISLVNKDNGKEEKDICAFYNYGARGEDYIDKVEKSLILDIQEIKMLIDGESKELKGRLAVKGCR